MYFKDYHDQLIVEDIEDENKMLFKYQIGKEMKPLKEFHRSDHLIYLINKKNMSIQVLNVYATSSILDELIVYR